MMLTPDEGFLDRRIAYEAGSLASHGWAVDVVSAVDPTLRYDGSLSPGVRLISGAGARAPAGRAKRALRLVKRSMSSVVPRVGRLIETAQYRLGDIAGDISSSAGPAVARLGRYDVVFAHDLPVLPLAHAIKKRWDCPLICDLHEVFPEQTAWITSRAGREYWRRIEADYFAECDALLVVNHGVGEYVRSRYGDTTPIAVIHNSLPYVDPEQLAGQRLGAYFPIPPDKRVMVWAGTLRSQTNLDTLIRGFSRAHLPGWVLAIVGDGPLEQPLKQLIRAEAADDRVFIGRRAPQDELVSVISSADVGLLAYQPESFNLLIATPNKLYEYIQARVPIATSPLPQIQRIVEAHGNGRFVDFASPESTAAGLRSFVDDELPSISARSLEAAARQFSWSHDEQRLLAVVDGVLGTTT